MMGTRREMRGYSWNGESMSSPGGGGVPLGVENLSQYTLLKMFICIPCRNIAPSLVPDRGPVINIVGWEALGSNPVINGVAHQ